MGKNKFAEKLRAGVSVKEIEDFTRNHVNEVFSIIAILIATITACWDYFTGPKLSIFFLALGTIITILFPVSIERRLKQFYSFSLKPEKSTQIVLGIVKIVVALFVPFVLFGVLGLLAGCSYHYYVRHANIIAENKPHEEQHQEDGGEHD